MWQLFFFMHKSDSLVTTMLFFVEEVFHMPSTDKDIWGYHHHALIPPVGNINNISIPYKYVYYVIE